MRRLTIFFICAAFISLLIAFISTIVPTPNDDAFIYFNYARNFTLGRPFAYDARNIPSEGFTSLFYLLLLIPFEFFKLNMSFSASLLNIIATVLTIGLASSLMYQTNSLTRGQCVGFALLLSLMILFDARISMIISWGLESLWGAASILLAVILFSKALRTSHNPFLYAFFVSLWVAYLIRPENMIFLAIVGVPLLWWHYPERRTLFVACLVFGIVLIAYHALKYVIFGNIFPTGFYRKVGNGLALDYIFRYVTAYGLWLWLLIFLIFVPMMRTHNLQIFRQAWAQMLVGIALLTLLFFLRSNPLIGVGFRFLISVTVILYVLVALFTVRTSLYFIEQVAWDARTQQAAMVGALLLIIVIAGVRFYFSPASVNGNLYEYAVTETDQHFYVRFGRYMRAHLEDSEEISFVFGDAGAVPYTLGGTFIDANGLTEPAIAHLFHERDLAIKTERYIDLILEQEPDLVVLGYGDLDEAGIWQVPINLHSPFARPIPAEVFQAYRDYGLVYICTADSPYYALHLGIAQQSAHYDALYTTLSAFCQQEGYVLAAGFRVQTDAQTIHFPLALAPSANSE